MSFFNQDSFLTAKNAKTKLQAQAMFCRKSVLVTGFLDGRMKKINKHLPSDPQKSTPLHYRNPKNGLELIFFKQPFAFIFGH